MDKFASISTHLHYLSFLLLIRPFVVVCFLIGSFSALANPGSVVFNSFQDRSLALRESVEISRKFGIETRIEEAMVNGLIYHRVLAPVMDQTSARELIRQARTRGLDDVWVLSWKELPLHLTDLTQAFPYSQKMSYRHRPHVHKELVQRQSLDHLLK